MSKSSINKSQNSNQGSPLRMLSTSGARHTPSKDRSGNILHVSQPLRDRSEEAKSIDRHYFIHKKVGDTPSNGRNSRNSRGSKSQSPKPGKFAKSPIVTKVSIKS